jgi:hypothetical protein
MNREMTETTWYAAMPIARRDDGMITTDEPVECATADAAVECARQMSVLPYYIGAAAFTCHGDPAGRFETEYLKRFGSIGGGASRHPPSA